MRILFSTPHYAPAYSYGGVVAATKLQAEGLVQRGHQVTVITTDVLDAETRNPILYENLNGVEVYRFKNFSNKLAKQVNYYSAKGIKHWLKMNIKNYDIVQVSDIFAFKMFFPVTKSALKNNIPYIIQPHGSLGKQHISHSSITKPIKQFVFSKAIKYINESKSFIWTSDNEKNDLPLEQLNINLVYIPIGISKINLLNKDIDIYKQYNLNNNYKIITFIGRLHSIKGLDLAIEILKYLKDKINFYYLIFGPDEGNEKALLSELINKYNLSENIKIMPPIYGSDKINILSSSDLFLLPSRAESQGITTLEALYCGLPTVVSQAASYKELEAYNAGKIIDVYNPQESADTIYNLLNDKELLKEMKKNAKKLVEDNFTVDIMLDRLENMYISVINK